MNQTSVEYEKPLLHGRHSFIICFTLILDALFLGSSFMTDFMMVIEPTS